MGKHNGVIGLGFHKLSLTFAHPLLYRLLAKLDKQQFSYYLSNNVGGADSQLVLGGVKPELYTGDFSYHKLVNKDYYWTIAFDDVEDAGKRMDLCPDSKCHAAVDTGSSYLVAPTVRVQKLLPRIHDSARPPPIQWRTVRAKQRQQRGAVCDDALVARHRAAAWPALDPGRRVHAQVLHTLRLRERKSRVRCRQAEGASRGAG